jgi:hydroxymethylglutaryl-CoA lyase
MLSRSSKGFLRRRGQRGSCFSRFLTTTTIGNREPQIKIVEVGPRDGLQNERKLVSTKDKISLCKMLFDAGCPFVEAGAFVSKKWVPAMADSMEVMEGLRAWRKAQNLTEPEKLILSCLTPNLVGFEHAVESGANEVAVFGSASEEFSQRNINATISESLQRFKQVAEKSKELNVPMRGYVSCVLVIFYTLMHCLFWFHFVAKFWSEKQEGSFSHPLHHFFVFFIQGCPYQGNVSPSEVAKVSEKLLALGCHEISLGDTIGVGTPATTKAMIEAVQVSTRLLGFGLLWRTLWCASSMEPTHCTIIERFLPC